MATPVVKIRDTDRGYEALKGVVFGFGKPTISTGILEADGEKHKATPITVSHARTRQTPLEATLNDVFGLAPDRPPEENEALTVIQVAIWNEFGTEDIPARSFIRAWFDEDRAAIRDTMRILMVSVVARKRTKEQALNALAQWCVGRIQQRIANHIDPPNRPSTVKAKGSDTPLVNGGQLRSAVSYRIAWDGR